MSWDVRIAFRIRSIPQNLWQDKFYMNDVLEENMVEWLYNMDDGEIFITMTLNLELMKKKISIYIHIISIVYKNIYYIIICNTLLYNTIVIYYCILLYNTIK